MFTSILVRDTSLIVKQMQMQDDASKRRLMFHVRSHCNDLLQGELELWEACESIDHVFVHCLQNQSTSEHRVAKTVVPIQVNPYNEP